MSRLQLLLVPFLTCAVLLIAGSLPQTKSPLAALRSASQFKVIPPIQTSPCPWPVGCDRVDALTLLNRAIARHSQDSIRWLQLELRQEAAIDDIRYSMRGRFLSAPGERVRLELHMRMGNVRCRRDIVSDGSQIAEKTSHSKLGRTVYIETLPTARQPEDDKDGIAEKRRQLLNARTMGGIDSLLNTISFGLVNPQIQPLQVDGVKFFEIKGAWHKRDERQADIPQELRLKSRVKECRIYLRAETLWPHRIEWWGANPFQEEDVLLLQTEYLNPIINQQLAAEELAREFLVSGDK